jgi:ankyrin repeat protein
VIELLLKAGADASAVCVYQRSPLHWASFRGQEVLLRALHAAGVAMGVKDPHSEDYAVHVAARGNHVAALRTLLELSPQLLNARGKLGKTALHLAAAGGSHLCVQLLLKLGADAALKDDQGLCAVPCFAHGKRA